MAVRKLVQAQVGVDLIQFNFMDRNRLHINSFVMAMFRLVQTINQSVVATPNIFKKKKLLDIFGSLNYHGFLNLDCDTMTTSVIDISYWRADWF